MQRPFVIPPEEDEDLTEFFIYERELDEVRFVSNMTDEEVVNMLTGYLHLDGETVH